MVHTKGKIVADFLGDDFVDVLSYALKYRLHVIYVPSDTPRDVMIMQKSVVPDDFLWSDGKSPVIFALV